MSKPIQVRGVPDDVREALVTNARAQGLSLSAYLRHVLEREARQPRLGDVLAHAGGRAPTATMDDVVALLRADRSRSA